MHRLFVASRPPPDIRRRLIGLMGGVPGARWQSDAQLHVTLRYIGEVDGRTAEAVAEALASLRARGAEVALCGAGAFHDRRGRTNALWAGLAPREPLEALHLKLDRALVRLGLEPERRAYLPHITLARFAASAGAGAGAGDAFVAAHAGLASPPFRLETMILYESRLGSDSAVYAPVAEYALE